MSAADLAGEVHDVLLAAGIGHAFGGALALNYSAPPRLTADVDVNVAVELERSGEIVGLFAARGFVEVAPVDGVRAPIAGIRLTRGRDVLDLFLAFDAYHERVVERAVTYPFSTGTRIIDLPFLSADDLTVMKLSFNRPKDWVDIEAMLEAGTPIDVEDVESQLVGFRGVTMYPRLAVLRRRVELATSVRRTAEGPPLDRHDRSPGTIGHGRRPSRAARSPLRAAAVDGERWATSRQGFRSHLVARETATAIITRCGQQLAVRNAILSSQPSGAQCPRCG